MDQLRALRVFVQVVNSGSFAGAARALQLAPSVVTRSVAELETHLGARLLQRTTRQLALTEIGAAYHAQAQRILGELDSADAMAGSAATKPRGVLKLLCPPAFAVHQLARVLPAFRAAYPQIRIELATPGHVDSADTEFDLSIVSVGQQALQGDFVARLLARSEIVICASPDYLRRHGRPLQPAELQTHDVLLLAVQSVRHDITLLRSSPSGDMERISLPAPKPVLASQHIETIHAAALAGLGVAGLPSFVVAEALRDGRLERLLPQWTAGSLKIHAAMPSRRHLPQRTRALVDHLVQCFGGGDADPWIDQNESKPTRRPTHDAD